MATYCVMTCFIAAGVFNVISMLSCDTFCRERLKMYTKYTSFGLTEVSHVKAASQGSKPKGSSVMKQNTELEFTELMPATSQCFF